MGDNCSQTYAQVAGNAYTTYQGEPEWDGMRWNGMRWNGMGWAEMSCHIPLCTYMCHSPLSHRRTPHVRTHHHTKHTSLPRTWCHTTRLCYECATSGVTSHDMRCGCACLMCASMCARARSHLVHVVVMSRAVVCLLLVHECHAADTRNRSTW